MLVSEVIFLCANRADEEWLRTLCRHLAPYRSKGLVTWDARDIPAGARPREATEAALAKARVAVLLVSPYFVAEELADDSETRSLLTTAAGNGLRMLWIPLSASAYEVTPLRDLQPLQDPERPLDALSAPERAQALVDICEHIGAALVPDHESAPADLANQPYRLVEAIRVGGLSTVWRGEETATGKQVAVKVLHPQYVKDSEIRRRFLRGASDAMRLNHPSIVRILDPHGEAHDRLYYVMQYIDGGTLRDAVLAGKLPPARAIPTVIDIGAALTYAHGQGTVHRDVHPGNILLDAQGRPYLADFDLVRSLKVDYAAPELVDDADAVDPRVDVYGLGMCAVFALHGKDFDREAAADVAGVIESLPCGRAVQGVLRKAVARRCEDRFETVAAFCSALSGAWSHDAAPAVASPVAASTPAPARPASIAPALTGLMTAETGTRVVENLAGAGKHVLRTLTIVIIGLAAILAAAILIYVKK